MTFSQSLSVIEGVVHGHSPEERVQVLAERIVVALGMGFCVYFTYLEEVSFAVHIPFMHIVQ